MTPEQIVLAYEEYKPVVYVAAFRALNDHEDAEDVVSEVGIKAWEKASQFTGKGTPENWFYSIARYHIIDILRMRRSRCHFDRVPFNEGTLDATLSQRFTPEDEAISWEAVSDILEAVDTLPNSQKEALTLWSAGESYQEIAEETGAPQGTVMSRLYHARQKVRGRLEKSS